MRLASGPTSLAERGAEPDDAAVVRRILDGDVNAFELLLDRHADRVTRIVKRHVPFREAGEVSQDVFTRVFESLSGFGGRGEFSAWVSAIATRTCADYWRRRYRNRETPESALEEEETGALERAAASRSMEIHEDADGRGEAAELLERALNELSPDDRMVVTLVHLEERTVKEAAQLLGWTVANVKVRAFRARRKLRRLIESSPDA